MEEEKDQKELFEFEPPKRPFSKLASMLPKADFEGRVAITLTLEKIIFISIGIVMLMVVIYALGVEGGRSQGRAPAAAKTPAVAKRPAPAGPRQQQKTVRNVQALSVPAVALQSRQAMAPQKTILDSSPLVPSLKAVSQNAISAGPKTAPAQGSSRGAYTIIAATFSRKDTAYSGAGLLNKEGLRTYIVYGEPYYRVYVGAYADKDSVQIQRDLALVKRIYKDARVTLR